jgi:hypothetical protein
MLIELFGEKPFNEPTTEEKDITLFGKGKEVNCRISWPDGFGFVAVTDFESDTGARESHNKNVGAITGISVPAASFTGAASGAEMLAGTLIDKKHYANQGKDEIIVQCVGVLGTMGATVGVKLVAPSLPQAELDRAATVVCTKTDEVIADGLGPANETSKPGVVPATAAPLAPGPPDESIIGLWSGPVTGDRTEYTIDVKFSQQPKGLFAIVQYPESKCEATWEQKSADSDSVTFQESVHKGRCLDGVPVRLTVANGQLHAEFNGTKVQSDMTRVEK